MKVIKNPATVEDKDLKRAYEIALKVLKEKGFKVKEVQMAISPFAPTYKKAMIVEISPHPKDVFEMATLNEFLQKKIGRKVGVSLI
ncbi:hypothetical protein [Desulfurobacterium indicum]|uniref:Uncharacterized protein n=1 Tax=Desulfurobacterium indicum TaxID=1914305 RepID=A0A1R1MKF9_9BACT|nr:hypothetical protein [Desulfurobacterium indicum]OMH40184.1 hypothetical protein BLW93_06685 [Desulfurobacterium indicum]